MDNITEFKSKYPDLYNAVFEEGKKDGHAAGLTEGEAVGLEKDKVENQDQAKADGAKAERERIQSVEAQLIPGHEALIQDMKFDGKTTGEQAAVKILAAEKTLREGVLDKLDKDAPDSVATVLVPDVEIPAAEKKDFEQLAADHQKEHNCTRGAAISAIAKEYPEKHTEYINKVNKRRE